MKTSIPNINVSPLGKVRGKSDWFLTRLHKKSNDNINFILWMHLFNTIRESVIYVAPMGDSFQDQIDNLQ